jgi:hypothetical protein
LLRAVVALCDLDRAVLLPRELLLPRRAGLDRLRLFPCFDRALRFFDRAPASLCVRAARAAAARSARERRGARWYDATSAASVGQSRASLTLECFFF